MLGDRHELQQVVLNLLTNAAQAVAGNPAGAPRTITVTTWADEQVHLRVADSGPGIPEDLVPRIFEHGLTTKRVDPMENGVGLALTRLVCRRRGGEIHVEQEDGATAFVARLGVTHLAEPVAAEARS